MVFSEKNLQKSWQNQPSSLCNLLEYKTKLFSYGEDALHNFFYTMLARVQMH